MTFLDFIRAMTGWERFCWAPRMTPRLAATYDGVLTPKHERELASRYLAAGGDPEQIGYHALTALGWRQVWVAPQQVAP